MAEFPLWAALAIIGASVLLMILCVACCAARCFRPQQSKGSAWYPNKEGKETYARGLFEGDDKKQGFVRVLEGGAGAGGAGGTATA